MSDQISRQKLIEELGMLYRTPIEDDETLEWNRAIYKAIEYTESQPPADQWIPCDIAVPAEPVGEYYKDVQIKKRSGEVVIGYYRNDDGEWWEIKGDDADRMLDAVEWRPLPEAYKGGNKYEHD